MIYPALTASFAAFGSTISIIGVGVSVSEFGASVDQARRLSEVWDKQFSRFRPDSLLMRVNASSTPVEVSPDFLMLLGAAVEGARKSVGRFDPSVLPALTAAGYREDFDQLHGRSVAATEPPLGEGLYGLERIVIDHDARTVLLPPGVELDFGGLAKGAFADRIASLLSSWPGDSVDAGGDLRVWGVAPDGPKWRVGIEHPMRTEEDVRTVEILSERASGVATSGVNRRRWHTTDGRIVNHLIDPRTGHPVESAPQSVTVFAATASAAEIEATSVLIAASRGDPIELVDSALAILVWDHTTIEVIEGRNPHATIIETRTSHRQSA